MFLPLFSLNKAHLGLIMNFEVFMNNNKDKFVRFN